MTSGNKQKKVNIKKRLTTERTTRAHKEYSRRSKVANVNRAIVDTKPWNALGIDSVDPELLQTVKTLKNMPQKVFQYN